MADAYVQDFQGTTATSSAPTASGTVTAGNTLVVAPTWGTNVGSVVSVTDNLGNTYVAAGAIKQSTARSVGPIYVAHITTGGAVTITATLSASQASANVWVYEISGSTEVTDGYQVGGPGPTTAASTAAITTTNADDILLAFYRGGSVTAVGSGWIRGTVATTTIYQLVEATGTYTPSWTISSSSDFAAVAVALKASGASAPTVTAQAATGISNTGATLNGTITADGGSNSTVDGFNWGPTVAYGNTISQSGSFGLGAFSLPLTGLTPGTTYHYRAFGTNATATGNSADATFTTTGGTAHTGAIRYDGVTATPLSKHGIDTTNLWDGSSYTWITPADASDWYGFDVGIAVVPSSFTFSCVAQWEDGLIGCVLQGDNNSGFTTPTTLATIANRPTDGVFGQSTGVRRNSINIVTSTAYRYYRMLVNSTNAKLGGFEVYANHIIGSLGSTASPYATPAGIHNALPTMVTLSCPTTDASIYYTVDGSTPDNTKTFYSGPFKIASSCTLKAIAIASGLPNSRAVSYDYYVANEWVSSALQYDVTSGYKMWGGSGNRLYDPVSGYWYVYGTSKDSLINDGSNVNPPCNIYKSPDLVNWQFVGPVAPDFGYTAGSLINGLGEQRRPIPFYNASTGKYVIWTCFVIFGQSTGVLRCYASSSPEGPFLQVFDSTATWQGISLGLGDLGGFQDANGTDAYLMKICSSNADLLIVKLASDYQSLDAANFHQYVGTATLSPFNQPVEAPVMYNNNGTYFLFYSNQTSYTPNTNFYSTASSPLPASWTGRTNPFVSQPGNNPNNTLAYDSQCLQILKIPGRGSNAFVYLGDRFDVTNFGGGTNNDFRNFIQLIIPTLSFPTSTTMSINWLASWNIDTVYPSDGTLSPAAPTNLHFSGNTALWNNNEPKAHALYVDKADDLLFTTNKSSTPVPAGTTSVSTWGSGAYRVRAVNASGTSLSQAAQGGTGQTPNSSDTVFYQPTGGVINTDSLGKQYQINK